MCATPVQFLGLFLTLAGLLGVLVLGVCWMVSRPVRGAWRVSCAVLFLAGVALLFGGA